ncbi:hypothetical protein LMG24238_07726 [Paraburkholderia sediminicola]|uniref:Uncharacterized protein n=1 Tax=Paraburkholderia sediminicola TaxID=458836 RepID=A0A6J5CTZ6_9BURK|nr:hypothetical protein LMG24238_07726 [Paraburkholderia sediminicola]
MAREISHRVKPLPAEPTSRTCVESQHLPRSGIQSEKQADTSLRPYFSPGAANT